MSSARCKFGDHPAGRAGADGPSGRRRRRSTSSSPCSRSPSSPRSRGSATCSSGATASRSSRCEPRQRLRALQLGRARLPDLHRHEPAVRRGRRRRAGLAGAARASARTACSGSGPSTASMARRALRRRRRGRPRQGLPRRGARRARVELFASPKPREVAAWLAERKPRVVAVDSPCDAAPKGRGSRKGERKLIAAADLPNVRSTPDMKTMRAREDDYYGWVLNGFRLYKRLEQRVGQGRLGRGRVLPDRLLDPLGGRPRQAQPLGLDRRGAGRDRPRGRAAADEPGRARRDRGSGDGAPARGGRDRALRPRSWCRRLAPDATGIGAPRRRQPCRAFVTRAPCCFTRVARPSGRAHPDPDRLRRSAARPPSSWWRSCRLVLLVGAVLWQLALAGHAAWACANAARVAARAEAVGADAERAARSALPGLPRARARGLAAEIGRDARRGPRPAAARPRGPVAIASTAALGRPAR